MIQEIVTLSIVAGAVIYSLYSLLRFFYPSAGTSGKKTDSCIENCNCIGNRSSKKHNNIKTGKRRIIEFSAVEMENVEDRMSGKVF